MIHPYLIKHYSLLLAITCQGVLYNIHYNFILSLNLPFYKFKHFLCTFKTLAFYDLGFFNIDFRQMNHAMFAVIGDCSQFHLLMMYLGFLLKDLGDYWNALVNGVEAVMHLYFCNLEDVTLMEFNRLNLLVNKHKYFIHDSIF